jgi:peptidoglycan/LPS O-acetylase OafA/YrhL
MDNRTQKYTKVRRSTQAHPYAKVFTFKSLSSEPIPLKEDYLPFLDGLRGLAAVWVIAFHTTLLTGAINLPTLIRRGDVAVQLFMILSGFLMTYHYYARQEREPWEQPGTWIKFYIRRFFRIAPLYYVLFLLYMIIGPTIGEYRQEIASHFYTAITDTSRYSDRSLTNIWMHLSFLFGASPAYSFRTPMPDWSIGLEMQFYAVFPFLMLMFRRNYFFVSAAVLYAVSVLINHYLKGVFVMPSFLPLSMNFFLIGMLLAVYNRFKDDRLKAPMAVGGALVLAFLSHEKLVVAIVLLMCALLHPSRAKMPLKPVAEALGSRFSTWLADMSYSAYLLHLAFMTPVAYWCLRWEPFLLWPGRYKFLVVFVLTVIPTYAVATALFHFIEKRGIIWGKRIVKNL